MCRLESYIDAGLLRELGRVELFMNPTHFWQLLGWSFSKNFYEFIDARTLKRQVPLGVSKLFTHHR